MSQPAFPAIGIEHSRTAGVNQLVYYTGMTYRQYVAVGMFWQWAGKLDPNTAGKATVDLIGIRAWVAADSLIAAEKEAAKP